MKTKQIANKDLKIGDYCLASKYSDEDPYDPWYIGYLEEIRITPDATYYKIEGCYREFKHCRKITFEYGANYIRTIKLLYPNA